MKKILILIPMLFIFGCDSSEVSSEDSESAEQLTRNSCSLNSTYAFVTTSNKKTHFDAYFGTDGVINYNLNGAPTGTYQLDGNAMTFTGPFGPGREDLSMVFNVSSGNTATCDVSRFSGRSPGGQAMVLNRT